MSIPVLFNSCGKTGVIDAGYIGRMNSNTMSHPWPQYRNLRSFLCGLVLLHTAHGICLAQSAQEVATQSPAPVAQLQSANWASLTPAQQTALAPLAKSWERLSEGQRRKWIAIAKEYPQLSEADKAKMHSRMVEWAALSPKDRELARLNYAQTKSVAKSDRAADWEAYQALSPEEKKKLAASATTKPVGAAVAPKPVAPSKLAAVPVTRHTPEEQRNALKASQITPVKKPESSDDAPLAEPAGQTSQPKS